MNAITEYLKYCYVTYIKCDDDDPYHDKKFSLKHGTFDEKERKSYCRDCNIPFKYLTDLESRIIDSSEQVDKILTGAANKFELFMRHKIRARLQDEIINEIFNWVKDGEPTKRIVVFLDFKMKVEPERLRETKLQFYGKSGRS